MADVGRILRLSTDLFTDILKPFPSDLAYGRLPSLFHDAALLSFFSLTECLLMPRRMSGYENVVGGKLKLKGKALDVKVGGVKKKKKHKHHYDQQSQVGGNDNAAGGSAGLSTDPAEEITEIDTPRGEGLQPSHDDQLTPAEKRYIEQKGKIDVHRHAKTANKSHRDRIEGFNQYLANLSEHYDIPKVGPG